MHFCSTYIVSCAFISLHSIQSFNSSLFILKVLLFQHQITLVILIRLPSNPGRPYFPSLTTDQPQKSHHLTQSPTTAGSSLCATAENHSPVCSTSGNSCKKKKLFSSHSKTSCYHCEKSNVFQNK